MSPGVALGTLDMARHHFNAGQDKPVPDFSLAASLSPFFGHAFSA
jgi:hypothetical protein